MYPTYTKKIWYWKPESTGGNVVVAQKMLWKEWRAISTPDMSRVAEAEIAAELAWLKKEGILYEVEHKSGCL